MVLIIPPSGGNGAASPVIMARAPVATDDSDAGYSIGQHWINTAVAPVQAYVATDVSVGAAVWQEVTSFDELTAHLADLANPHVTDVGNLGSGTLAELNVAITDATLDDSGDPRNDPDAIHDNVAAEITAVDEKATPIGADIFLIEDSADANNKKRVQLANLPNAKIKLGSYTGDGSTSQGITGIGFLVMYLLIWERTTANQDNIQAFETSTDIVADNAAGGCYDKKSDKFAINAIISLDADGFTVDDAGSDEHPNKSGQVYNFMAMG